jgi:Cu+-exporting ATPase
VSTLTDAQSVELKVLGMTCEHCVRRVTKAIESLPGIEKVDVSLADEKASFVWDPSQIEKRTIIKAIEEAGYEVEDPEYKPESIDVPSEISVYGMTCEHCVNRVRKALEQLAGLKNVNVSLQESKANFTYNPDKVKAADIQKAIEDAGYSVTPILDEEQGSELVQLEGESSPVVTDMVIKSQQNEENEKQQFKVTGMTCANCALTIEKGLAKMPGVKLAAVNFASGVSMQQTGS